MHYVDPEHPTSIAVFTMNCKIQWNSMEEPVRDEDEIQ